MVMNMDREIRKLLDIDQENFHKISKLNDWELGGEILDLGLATHNGCNIFGRIETYKTNLMRLRLSLNPIANKNTLMLVNQDMKHIKPDCYENKEELIIKTDKITIQINKAPFKFMVFDAKNRPLICEDLNDTETFLDLPRDYKEKFQHPYVSFPLGYVEGVDGKYMVGSFEIMPDESFYGMGEKYSRLNKRGQIIQSFLSNGIAAQEGNNKSVPFLMSSRGYGLFFNSLAPQLFDIGVKSNSTCSFGVADDLLDIFIIYGPTYKELLMAYTELTGRSPLPPKWSFGIWMSRVCYWDQEEMEQVAGLMRKKHLPCDVLRLDCPWFIHYDNSLTRFSDEWDEKTFPEPEKMLKRFKDNGYKVCMWWYYSFIKTAPIYMNNKDKGYFIEDPFDPNCAMVDLTNPEAAEWLKERLKAHLEKGITTFFLDDGMFAPVDNVYKTAKPLEGRNSYGFLYPKLAHEAIYEHTGKQGITWGLQGIAGTQRFPATGGADARSNFRDMAAIIRGGLSAAMSGYSIWGCDIGGMGIYPGPRPEKEYYIRHVEQGFFQPIAKLHGTGEREPWYYGEDIEQIYRKYAQLRYRLLPYIYTNAYLSGKTGIPFMRPMVLEYQYDPAVNDIDDQYMFGDAFLVAPILGHDKDRWIYLPEGMWTDYWNGEKWNGGRHIRYKAKLDTLPLFVREGSIITMGPIMQYVDEVQFDQLTLDIYPKRGEFSTFLYNENREQIIRCVDDGTNIDIFLPEGFDNITILLHDRCAREASAGNIVISFINCDGNCKIEAENCSQVNIKYDPVA